MGKTVVFTTRVGTSIAANLTNYSAISQSIQTVLTIETNIYQTYNTAGIFSDLYARIVTNDRPQSTIRIRKNGGNGNQVLVIGASTTGEFEDTTNQDICSVGDEFCIQLITGNGGTIFIPQLYRLIFNDSTNTSLRFAASCTPISTASTTFFGGLVAGLVWTSTAEENAQNLFRYSGILSNLVVNMNTNGRSTDSTIGIRKNGVNGNLLVTIPGGATGLFSDTLNSDIFSNGDKANYYATLGTGTGGLEFFCSVDISTTTNIFPFLTCGVLTVNANTTNYIPISGRTGQDTTEGEIKGEVGIVTTLTNLAVFVSANSVTADSTLRFRKNENNGNQVITIASSTTGWFEDTTNSDITAAIDEVCYQLITGATGTNLSITAITMKAVTESSFIYPLTGPFMVALQGAFG